MFQDIMDELQVFPCIFNFDYTVSRYMVHLLHKLTAYVEVYLYLSLLIYETYFVTGRNSGGHIVYYDYQITLYFSAL
jgi:hypothetical protein